MKGLKPGWAVKALVVALLLRCFSDAAAATNHSVGGAFGWDLSSDLQEWASQATFHVGDSLVFRYTPVHNVLEVNAADYGICHTVNPLETYKDGETVIPLMEEGDRYFMCGRLGHCAMGLKLHVHVLPQLMISSATSSAPGPSPTASAPHATLLDTLTILCLGGLCTLGTIVHPVYSTVRVLMHGWDQERDRFSEIIIPLLTSTLWLYHDLLQGHLWIILGFKVLTIMVEMCSLITVLVHVQPTNRLLHCLSSAALFNVSIPLNLLLTTSVRVVGSCAVLSNMLVFAWPIYIMKNVIRAKKCNKDDISLGETVIGLLTGLVGNLYGYMMEDFYFAFPNMIGVFVAIAQLVVIQIYREHAHPIAQLEEGNDLQQPLLEDSQLEEGNELLEDSELEEGNDLQQPEDSGV